MALAVPNEGELQMMSIVLNGASVENLYIALYTNDYTPLETSTLTDFTIASGGGSDQKILTNGAWTCTTSGNGTYGQYGQQTWTFTSDVGSIYGYLIYGATSGKVYWAQRLENSETTYNGKLLKITPYIEFA